MVCVRTCRIAFISILAWSGGCRMAVPIHVWQPARLQSTVGKRVVLQTVAGPEETAAIVKDKLLTLVPQDTGRATTIVQASELQQDSTLQLVSATDSQPSDVAVASAARRQGFDYVLRGEVLQQAGESNQQNDPIDQPQPPLQQRSQATAKVPENPRLLLSWRLAAIGPTPSTAGQPVACDLESALQRYPDLSMLGDPKEVLAIAAARETYRLITPSVDRQRVQLAIPYLTLGSRQVRQGNLAALSGRWAEAERIWSEVLEKHPLQAAAAHNLALAAVAGQDFSRAKKLARQAVRLQPTPLHKNTLVWIELRQRDYHKSFQLPDPPEGWFVTQSEFDP